MQETKPFIADSAMADLKELLRFRESGNKTKQMVFLKSEMYASSVMIRQLKDETSTSILLNVYY